MSLWPCWIINRWHLFCFKVRSVADFVENRKQSTVKTFIMTTILKQSLLRVTTAIIFCCFSVIAFAQDKKLDVDINVNEDKQWYMQPWAWVIGGAVFILLLVALLRGSGSKKAA